MCMNFRFLTYLFILLLLSCTEHIFACFCLSAVLFIFVADRQLFHICFLPEFLSEKPDPWWRYVRWNVFGVIFRESWPISEIVFLSLVIFLKFDAGISSALIFFHQLDSDVALKSFWHACITVLKLVGYSDNVAWY